MKNETRKKINALLNGKKEQYQTDELIKLFLTVISEQHEDTKKSFGNHSKDIVAALSKIDFKPSIKVEPPKVIVNVPKQEKPNIEVNVPKQEKPNVEVNIPDEIDIKKPTWYKDFHLPANFFERIGIVFTVALNTLRDRKRPISVNVIDDKGQIIRQFGGVSAAAPAGGGQERTIRDPVTSVTEIGTTAKVIPKKGVLSNRKSILLFNTSAVEVRIGGADVTMSNGIPIAAGTFSPPMGLSEQSNIFGIVASGKADVIAMEVA